MKISGVAAALTSGIAGPVPCVVLECLPHELAPKPVPISYTLRDARVLAIAILQAAEAAEASAQANAPKLDA